jgi:hypothetical protein
MNIAFSLPWDRPQYRISQRATFTALQANLDPVQSCKDKSIELPQNESLSLYLEHNFPSVRRICAKIYFIGSPEEDKSVKSDIDEALTQLFLCRKVCEFQLKPCPLEWDPTETVYMPSSKGVSTVKSWFLMDTGPDHLRGKVKIDTENRFGLGNTREYITWLRERASVERHGWALQGAMEFR